VHRAKGIDLSENTAATGAEPAGAERPPGKGDAVLLFVGGPLDGRVEIRPAELGAPLETVTHVHLHDGPKVVHRYDLEPLTDEAAVYTVRPRARQNTRDESVAD
jgi:hypothetical protein